MRARVVRALLNAGLQNTRVRASWETKAPCHFYTLKHQRSTTPVARKHGRGSPLKAAGTAFHSAKGNRPVPVGNDAREQSLAMFMGRSETA